jgi:hypothetical protein
VVVAEARIPGVSECGFAVPDGALGVVGVAVVGGAVVAVVAGPVVGAVGGGVPPAPPPPIVTSLHE